MRKHVFFQSSQCYSQWTSFESCLTKRSDDIVRKEARMEINCSMTAVRRTQTETETTWVRLRQSELPNTSLHAFIRTTWMHSYSSFPRDRSTRPVREMRSSRESWSWIASRPRSSTRDSRELHVRFLLQKSAGNTLIVATVLLVQFDCHMRPSALLQDTWLPSEGYGPIVIVVRAGDGMLEHKLSDMTINVDTHDCPEPTNLTGKSRNDNTFQMTNSFTSIYENTNANSDVSTFITLRNFCFISVRFLTYGIEWRRVFL